MSVEITEDPIPQAVKEFLVVFKEDLAGVSFPDVSVEILEKLSEEIHDKTVQLQEALALVSAAQEALENAQNELIQKANRGLAYAKVFAEGKDELAEKLSRLSLGKPGRAPKKNSGEQPEPKRSRTQEEPAA